MQCIFNFSFILDLAPDHDILFSCGKDVASRTAIRHMETCFNKFESMTSFGSMYKTKIEGYQMFCDFYNPQTGFKCCREEVTSLDNWPSASLILIFLFCFLSSILLQFPCGKEHILGAWKCKFLPF